VGNGPQWLVDFNLLKHSVAWKLPTSLGAKYQITDQHVYFFSTKKQAPSGFSNGTTQRYTTAYSSTSGKRLWTIRDPEGSGSANGRPIQDGPSGVPGHPEATVIEENGVIAAYDGSTGKLLWQHTPLYKSLGGAGASYIAYGISESVTQVSDEEFEHTGFNVITGQQAWTFTSTCAEGTNNPTGVSSNTDSALVGPTEWQFGNGCVLAHDVRTGALVRNVTEPASWRDYKSVAGTQGICVYGGSRLAFFKYADLSTPTWSIPAGSSVPVVTAADYILVKSPSGLLVVSAATGAIRSHVDARQFYVRSNAGNATDNLAVSNGLVEADLVSGQVAVLDLDIP